jgi:hypothetical protein
MDAASPAARCLFCDPAQDLEDLVEVRELLVCVLAIVVGNSDGLFRFVGRHASNMTIIDRRSSLSRDPS